MNANAWIALISAIISVCVLIANLMIAAWARKISQGQAQTGLRSSITVTRQAVRTLTLEIAELLNGRAYGALTVAEKRRIDPVIAAFKEALEDNLNAYESACGQYLDRKVDRVRFRKEYIDEITDLCESPIPEIREKLHPAETSEFEAIWAAYREWNTRER